MELIIECISECVKNGVYSELVCKMGNQNNIIKAELSSYPGYFRESHWLSMGLPEISRVTWQLCACYYLDICNHLRLVIGYSDSRQRNTITAEKEHEYGGECEQGEDGQAP